jgi:DNA-binding transcriptional LysR family regulator
MVIELSHVRYFHEVAQAGGFTKAARKVHVQQPSVSRAVRLFEEELGVTLIARGRRSATLTKVGREVFALTSEVMRLLDAISVAADNERNACSGPLRFAAQSAVVAGIVPRANAALMERFPDVWPMTHTVPVGVAIDPIVRGELEFGLFFHLPAERRRDVVVERLADVPFALVVSASRASDEKTLTSFIGSREIEDEGTRSYPTLERLRRDRPSARIRVSCNDVAGQKEMALAGLGVAILPRRLVRAELADGTLHELYAGELTFPLYLLARQGQPLSRAAQLYIEAVRAEIETARLEVSQTKKKVKREPSGSPRRAPPRGEPSGAASRRPRGRTQHRRA